MAYPDFDPDWATEDTVFIDGTNNKERPAPSLRQYGYSPNAFPTVQELNWQLWNLGEFVKQLRADISSTKTEMPVGYVMMLSGVSDSPADLLGYGTWERFGTGRTIIGAGTGVDVNNVSRTFVDGESVGEYEHKITTAEMPSHTHTGGITGPQGGITAKVEGYPNGAPNADNYVPVATGSTGANQPHNNIQPSIVCYMWRRTA